MEMKFIFIGLAILLALGGAFASKTSKEDACEYYPQYRKQGGSYIYVGEYGYNFYCQETGGVCTYYKPNPLVEIYLPCHTGLYTPIYP